MSHLGDVNGGGAFTMPFIGVGKSNLREQLPAFFDGGGKSTLHRLFILLGRGFRLFPQVACLLTKQIQGTHGRNVDGRF